MASRRVIVLLAVLAIVKFEAGSVQSLQHQPQPPQEDSPQQQEQAQQQQQHRQQPFCTLGDDVFEVGERWNPNLPPFGVQVCVLCECTIRQKKTCYETKVTCRRITNECPVIDSCPDGKKPVTVAGQCCKSCQSDTTTTTAAATTLPTTTTTIIATTTASSTSTTAQSSLHNATSLSNLLSPATTQQSITTTPADNYRPNQSVATSISTGEVQQQQPQQWFAQMSPTMPTVTTVKLLYLNERTKEYLALVKSLPLCPNRDANSDGQRPNNQQTSTLSPSPVNVKPKGQSSKNELNGIDTRMAFKSLHDSAYPSPARNRPNNGMRHNTDTAPHDDLTRHDHQHPNDYQSTIAMTNYQISPTHDQNPSMHNNRTNTYRPTRTCNNRPGVNSTSDCDTSNPNNTANRGHAHPSRYPSLTYPPIQQENTCLLGNDTFQIGDMWNPVLPPFGIQVCVQCNCVIKERKNCYVTRVTCRRINEDCPKIGLCPDGSLPVSVPGQCCKSCQTEGLSSVGEVLQLENVVQRNETVIREYQAISKSMQICGPQRDNHSSRSPTAPSGQRHPQTKRSQRTSSK